MTNHTSHNQDSLSVVLSKSFSQLDTHPTHHTVKSSNGKLVTQSTRHTVNSSPDQQPFRVT